MTRWGVLLPTFDPLRTGGSPRVVEAARLAERLGFTAAWVGDHLACPAPVLDAPACLAAAAAVTDRISLGLSVMQLALRPPAWAAKQLATIDALSDGRLLLGVGVGGEFPDEFAAAGVPVRERGARLDETLGVLGDLLGGRPVRHDGRTLRLQVPALEPAMRAPPPPLRRRARRGGSATGRTLRRRLAAAVAGPGGDRTAQRAPGRARRRAPTPATRRRAADRRPRRR